MIRIRGAEREVLCHVVLHPNEPIKAIAEKIGMNYWSVYKIIEKYKKNGFIREVVIPNFRFLGYEILFAGYGSLTKKKVELLRSLKESGNLKGFTSKVFYGLSESYRGFVLGVARNYTEVKKTLISAEKIMKLKEVMADNEINVALLPIEVTRIPIFFDYAGILCKEAGIQADRFMNHPAVSPDRRLTRREKIAVFELTRNPGIAIKQLAERMGVTIQTASKIKNRLFQDGLLIRRIIPDLRMLGYEVVVFAHWSANPEVMSAVEKIEPEEIGVDISNITFLAYDILEGVTIAPFRSLKESREIISFFENFGEKTGVLAGQPKIMFLSLQESIMVRDHEYTSLLNGFLP